MDENTLLQVKDLKTYFYTPEGVSKAVDGVTFAIKNKEVLGLVGESGCGKTVTSLSVMRLIQEPPGKIESGQILFRENGSEIDILKKDKKEMRSIRGNKISMIFQEPMTSLNPVFTVGSQIAEVYRIHRKYSKKEALEASAEMLKTVRIPNPEQRLHEYPHQLSGGMRQRVMIAMALACNPALLIADEPTTALDVTVQAQILELMQKLQDDFGSSILMITHDLGVIAEMAHKIAIMYAGLIVEYGTTLEIYDNPAHPYTVGLLKSIPRLDLAAEKKQKLNVIEGNVPSPVYHPSGCRFHPRCPLAVEECKTGIPKLVDTGGGHLARCIKVKGTPVNE
jgi:oligopeptide/dipeptide ABC transporter ATP-binding protein